MVVNYNWISLVLRLVTICEGPKLRLNTNDPSKDKWLIDYSLVISTTSIYEYTTRVILCKPHNFQEILHMYHLMRSTPWHEHLVYEHLQWNIPFPSSATQNCTPHNYTTSVHYSLPRFLHFLSPFKLGMLTLLQNWSFLGCIFLSLFICRFSLFNLIKSMCKCLGYNSDCCVSSFYCSVENFNLFWWIGAFYMKIFLPLVFFFMIVFRVLLSWNDWNFGILFGLIAFLIYKFSYWLTFKGL